MDAILSKEEAARCFKVSLPTFNKYVKSHPSITQGKVIIVNKLKDCIEKESARAGSDKGGVR